MKKIVVPVDFSNHSEYALKTAATIARKQNMEIVVVHMIGLNEAMLSKGATSGMEGVFYLQLTKKRFEEFLDKDYLEGISVKEEVKNYKIFSEINEVAEEQNADLIVMGSHGSSGLSEIFVGSNTEKVVRTATVPVLVVKSDEEFLPNKAIFACDFRSESLPAFKKANALFKSLDITVRLVYINTPDTSFLSTQEIEDRIVSFLSQLEDEVKLLPEDVTIYSDYSIERGIFNVAEKYNVDVIGLPTHGRSGLAHFFSGSIGENMVNHSSLPVITFKL